MSTEELQDDQVYSVNVLMETLASYNLPHSMWWVRKAERLGIIPTTKLGSYQRKYTGKSIKKVIADLLNRLND